MSRVSEQPLADIFFALSDETRLSIVGRLNSGARLSITTLSDHASVTRQAITKHLRVLENAGLVAHEKEGREALYALQRTQFEEVQSFLDDISAGWDHAIERLRKAVETTDIQKT